MSGFWSVDDFGSSVWVDTTPGGATYAEQNAQSIATEPTFSGGGVPFENVYTPQVQTQEIAYDQLPVYGAGPSTGIGTPAQISAAIFRQPAAQVSPSQPQSSMGFSLGTGALGAASTLAGGLMNAPALTDTSAGGIIGWLQQQLGWSPGGAVVNWINKNWSKLAVGMGVVAAAIAIYSLLRNGQKPTAKTLNKLAGKKVLKTTRRYSIGKNPRLGTLIKVSKRCDGITRKLVQRARHAGILHLPTRHSYSRGRYRRR